MTHLFTIITKSRSVIIKEMASQAAMTTGILFSLFRASSTMEFSAKPPSKGMKLAPSPLPPLALD
jgi:hypothetical protein